MGEKFQKNFAESGHFHVTFGFFYVPSDGRRAEIFFARKIRRLRPGLNPRTWVPKASTLTSRLPKPLETIVTYLNIIRSNRLVFVIEILGEF